MPRRLLPLAALVLAVALGAGCAEDVSPAAQVGDTITISNTDLMDEVETWADSPGMVSGLEMGDPAGPGPGSFATSFVNGVLGFRIGFELHNEQFDALGLELTPEEVDQVRSGIFGTQSEQVLDELGEEYADQLVMDVARQFAVQQAMGEEYQPWLVERYSTTDVEVNPRYGSWDKATGTVVPPEGPTSPPTTVPLAEP